MERARIYLRPPRQRDWKIWSGVREESREFLVPWEPTWPYDALTRGSTIDRYVVLERLGAGGMGVVYAAYDPELDRRVAIKLVLPKRQGTGRHAATRLLREAQGLARVSHPNVVGIHDVGTVTLPGQGGEQVYIAMDFIEGAPLSRWIADQTRTIAELLEVFMQAGNLQRLVAASRPTQQVCRRQQALDDFGAPARDLIGFPAIVRFGVEFDPWVG